MKVSITALNWIIAYGLFTSSLHALGVNCPIVKLNDVQNMWMNNSQSTGYSRGYAWSQSTLMTGTVSIQGTKYDRGLIYDVKSISPKADSQCTYKLFGSDQKTPIGALRIDTSSLSVNCPAATLDDVRNIWLNYSKQTGYSRGYAWSQSDVMTGTVSIQGTKYDRSLIYDVKSISPKADSQCTYKLFGEDPANAAIGAVRIDWR